MQSRLELWFFVALFVAVLVLAALIFLPYLSALAVALVFAIVFRPLYLWLRRAVGHESVASFLSVLVILLIIAAPVTFVGYKIFGEAVSLYEQQVNGMDSAPNLVPYFEEKIREFLPWLDINVNAYVEQGLNWLLQNLGPLFSGVARAGLLFFISLFALYYLFKDGARLKELLLDLSPLSGRHNAQILDKLYVTIHAVVRGTLVIALIQGFLVGIGFKIFGVPNATLWGSLAVVAALFPTIGTGLVTLPAVFYLFFVDQSVAAFGLLGWGLLIVGLVDNFLRPFLLDRGTNMHPFLVLVSVLGGISLFGPAGFLLGPLVLSLLYVLLEIYRTLLGERT